MSDDPPWGPAGPPWGDGPDGGQAGSDWGRTSYHQPQPGPPSFGQVQPGSPSFGQVLPGQPPYGPPPFGAPVGTGGPYGGPPKRGRGLAIGLSVLVVVLVLGGGITAAILVSGGGDSSPRADPTRTAGHRTASPSTSPSLTGFPSEPSTPSVSQFPSAADSGGTGYLESPDAAGNAYFLDLASHDLSSLQALVCPGTTVTLTDADLARITTALPDGAAVRSGRTATMRGTVTSTSGSEVEVVAHLATSGQLWCLARTTS